MPRLLTFSDEASWIESAAEAVTAAIREALRRGQCRFDATLSGGTTPAPLYAALAASPAVAGLAARIDLHFWVGDERDAPADGPDRNGAAIAAALAAVLGAADGSHSATLHRWPEGDRAASCALYADEIASALGPVPVFDLAILGMGADGHAAGLFTMEQVRASDAPGIITLSTQAPSPPIARMTMGAALLRRSRSVMVFLRGHAKADTLRAVLAGGAFPAASIAGRSAVFRYLET